MLAVDDDTLVAELGADAPVAVGFERVADRGDAAAPRQRNTDEEKAAIRAGKTAAEIWPDEPAKAAQKDTDAR